MPANQPPLLSRPVDGAIVRLLQSAPAYQRLDGPTQAELAESMAKIAGYLADGGQALAEQLAPADLRSRLSPQSPANNQSPAAGQAPAAPDGSGGQRSATIRAGEVARATLNAIDFPEFVASLIQGTFQAIVDASIQQMEAYAELLKNVALTVDQFMEDNISDGTARDYLADRYDSVFTRDTTTAEARLRVRDDADDDVPLPSFFKGLGFDAPSDIDEDTIDEVIVPETRRTLAEQRQQMLATMVLMGINRVVVDDGEITAKLQFHIDASETLGLKFDQTKTTVGNLAGRSGRSMFTGNGIMVNTTSLNAQSDINVRADLTGQVKVRFRSETFPLERFADSVAIQLINSRAQVPGPATPPSQGAVSAPAATPVAQSLAAPDPWAPRGTS